MNSKKDEIVKQIVFWSILVIMVASLITEAIMFIRFEMNGEVINGVEGAITTRTRSDYILIFVMGIPALCCLLIPVIMRKKFKVEMPSILQILYCVFLFSAVVLGEIGRCYYTVPHFDDILHAFSSAMFGALGFSIVNFATKKNNSQLAPFFMALFAFSFAVMLGSVWEIMEFTMDNLGGLNAQKALMADGTPLMGKEALFDTMKDIIVDCCGALAMSLVGLVSLRGEKVVINKIMLRNTEESITETVNEANDKQA